MGSYEKDTAFGKRDTIEFEAFEAGYETEESEPEDRSRDKRIRRRNRKKKMRKRLLPTLMILIVLAAGCFAFAKSAYFNVETIAVSNNEYYTDEQIIKLSKVKTKVNLFSVKRSSVEKELIKDPYIKNAEVTYRLPDTVKIKVTERVERAAVRYDGKYYIIDGFGSVLAVREDKPDITRVIKLTVEEGKEGEPLSVKENSMYTKTLNMLNAASRTTARFTAVWVTDTSVKAYVYKNLYVRGTPEDIQKCIESGKLEAVLYDLTEKDIRNGMVRIGKDEYCVFSPKN